MSPVLIQWRQHTGPWHMFTRLPQQTVSRQGENNILQEDADGTKTNIYTVITYMCEDKNKAPYQLAFIS